MKPDTVFVLIGGVLAGVVASGLALSGNVNSSFLIPEWAQHRFALPAASIQTATRDTEPNGRALHTVRYGTNGFEPASLSVARGESIRFFNESGLAMRIVMERDTAPSLTYVQPESGGRGAVFQVSMHEPGRWRISAMNGMPTATAALEVR